jgi:glycosyltransferase involved in cell wall biosynthesis
MRLLILHQAWVFGGAERTTHNLISYLDRKIVRHLTLAAPAALLDHMPPLFDDFIDTGHLIMNGWFVSAEVLRADVESTRDILRQAQPDVVLGMMHYSSALVALAVRGLPVPIKAIGSFRGPIYEYIRRYEKGWLRRAFLHAAIALTARRADCLIVPSQGTAMDSRWRFMAPASRIRVIPNGIDGDSVRRRATEGVQGLEALPPSLPRLCVAARLSEEKDVGLVIEAMGILKNNEPCTLVIVGDGPLRPVLEKRAWELGLDGKILFVGHRENVYPYMQTADIYIHTCQFEGFGYSMLEAMACGTPVIATDCPHGPREVLAQGQAGVLVRPGSAEALASAISRLINDPVYCSHLQEQGLKRARELSVKNMVDRYQQVFIELAVR